MICRIKFLRRNLQKSSKTFAPGIDVSIKAPLQNAFSTAPMIVQPTMLFTPSISVSIGFRIPKA